MRCTQAPSKGRLAHTGGGSFSPEVPDTPPSSDRRPEQARSHTEHAQPPWNTGTTIRGAHGAVTFPAVPLECMPSDDCQWNCHAASLAAVFSTFVGAHTGRIAGRRLSRYLLPQLLRPRASIRDNLVNTELPMTVSIDLTTLQPDDTLHSLLSRADHATYRAKQTGRNRTCMENPHSSYDYSS